MGPYAMKPENDSVYVMSERQISMMITKGVSNSIISSDYKGSQVVCYEVKDEQREMPESVGHTKQACV